MGDSSMISMEAWITGHFLRRQCHHPAFLQNKANQRFGNDFNDGVEFGGPGRIGAGRGESGMSNSALPRVIRRGSVSGYGFFRDERKLRNEPNPGFDRQFKAREITQYFYGTNPMNDSSTISMAAWSPAAARVAGP